LQKFSLLHGKQETTSKVKISPEELKDLAEVTVNTSAESSPSPRVCPTPSPSKAWPHIWGTTRQRSTGQIRLLFSTATGISHQIKPEGLCNT